MNDRIQEIREALQHRRTSSIYEAIYRDNHESYITFLLSEVERLQQALGFYADIKTYETNVVDQWQPVALIDIDLGDKARTALSHLKG